MNAAVIRRFFLPVPGRGDRCDAHGQYAGRRRVGLSLTGAGWWWILAVFALLAIAINYSHNLIFAMAFVMLSLWLQSALLCRRNLKALHWHPATALPVFAGERISAGGTIAESAGYKRYALQLEVGDACSLAVDLEVKSDVRLEAGVLARRRGVQQIETMALVSFYPFGLWRCRENLPGMEAMIYPAPNGDAGLPVAAPVPAHRQLANDNFHGVRRYAAGDPVRRINWRVYGRTESLVINQFDGANGGEALWLRWEHTQGETEDRLGQLSAWVLEAQREGLEYGLALGHQQFVPRRGLDHQDLCLKALALFDRRQVNAAYQEASA